MNFCDTSQVSQSVSQSGLRVTVDRLINYDKRIKNHTFLNGFNSSQVTRATTITVQDAIKNQNCLL